jgi:SNF2 family DNA or RNA helicase
VPPTLVKNGDQLELSLSGCRGSEFQDAKEKIRAVPGRRWSPEDKVWITPADPQTAERILKTIRPECDPELVNWISASKANHEESLTSPLPDDSDTLLVPWAYQRSAWQPKEVNGETVTGLLPYQRAAVHVMAERGRAILADDMGLGKTFQLISAVEEWKLRNGQAEGPSLIVAPNSVKGAWKRELERWLEDPLVRVIDGAVAKRQELLDEVIEGNGWAIVNWEQLRIKKEVVKTRNGGRKTVVSMKEPRFQNTEWLSVLADEIHRAKNRDSQQTKGLWRVNGKVMFGATGTPIMNSPDEIWSLLRWLWPEQYHELGARKNAVAYWAFYEDYVDYWEDHFGKKVITGVKNPDALRFALKDKLIRRTAAILGLKGRKRIYYSVPLNPKQQKLYNEAEKQMWLEVEQQIDAGDANAIEFAKRAASGESVSTLWNLPNGAARLVRLQQIIENPALLGGDDDSAVMDDFEEKFSDSRPYQWVVYCKYKESCNILAERLRRKHGATVGVYHGDVRPVDRTELEDEFQRGEIDVMVGTIGAMREGITLTGGHLMYFLTRDFVPDNNEQAEARCDRLGQQELVRVYIPQAEATVATDKVDPINRLKEKIVRTVIPKQDIQEETQ